MHAITTPDFCGEVHIQNTFMRRCSSDYWTFFTIAERYLCFIKIVFPLLSDHSLIDTFHHIDTSVLFNNTYKFEASLVTLFSYYALSYFLLFKYNAPKDGRATLWRVLKTYFWHSIHFISSLQEKRINAHVVLQVGRKYEVMTVIRGTPCATHELLWHPPPLSKVVMVETYSKCCWALVLFLFQDRRRCLRSLAKELPHHACWPVLGPQREFWGISKIEPFADGLSKTCNYSFGDGLQLVWGELDISHSRQELGIRHSR